MIELEGIVTKDGKLLVQIPDNLLAGRVKVTIDPIEEPAPDASMPLTREEARQRLAAAGFLANTDFIPDDLVRPDIAPLVLPPGAKTTEQLIDEDRREK